MIKQRNMGGAWHPFINGLFALGMALAGLTGLWGEIDDFGRNFCWILLVVALILLAIALFIYLKNRKRYQDFYQLFPELHGKLDTLSTNSEYISEKMGVAIYKRHLIGYKAGRFKAVDLNQANDITYVWRHGGRRRLPAAILKVRSVSSDQILEVYLAPLGTKTLQPYLDELYAYIKAKYPSISLN